MLYIFLTGRLEVKTNIVADLTVRIIFVCVSMQSIHLMSFVAIDLSFTRHYISKDFFISFLSFPKLPDNIFYFLTRYSCRPICYNISSCLLRRNSYICNISTFWHFWIAKATKLIYPFDLWHLISSLPFFMNSEKVNIEYILLHFL